MTYINEYQVLSRPYWTKAHLNKIRPDLTAKHPQTNQPVRFYSLSTLQRMERSSAWQEHINKENLLQLIQKANVTVERMDYNTARIEAVAAYNRLHQSEPGFTPATPSSTPAFIDRITVNHLRHNHTSYDKTLKLIAQKHGKAQAYALLKNRTLDAIALSYPQLTRECQAQRVNILEVLRQLNLKSSK